MRLIANRPLAWLAAAAIVCASPSVAGAQEQQQAEFESWGISGWSFTPGVVVGALFDSNVGLANVGPGMKAASDKLFELQPYGQLEFNGRRTMFASGYQGFLRRYFDFDELNGFDSRAYMQLRQKVTRRVTLLVDDNFLQTPTTDQLQLNGIPFQRTGSRYNGFSATVQARLTPTVDLNNRYEFTWVDFVRKDTFLHGGFVNGDHTDVTKRLTDRASAGGEYGIRFADLNEGTHHLSFQEMGGVFRYRLDRDTLVETSGGMAFMHDYLRDDTRTGPYVRARLTHHAARAVLGAEAGRTYVPTFAFGGSNQSEFVEGFIQMPISRNRMYVEESFAYRRSIPFLETETPLDSVWQRSVVGYALQRWFRLEGYYQFTHQDTRLPGGNVNRHVAGVQFVVAQPVRLPS
jgi:hypothetical protein